MSVYYYVCCDDHWIKTDVIAKLNSRGIDFDTTGQSSLEKFIEDHKDCKIRLLSENDKSLESYSRLILY